MPVMQYKRVGGEFIVAEMFYGRDGVSFIPSTESMNRGLVSMLLLQ